MYIIIYSFILSTWSLAQGQESQLKPILYAYMVNMDKSTAHHRAKLSLINLDLVYF